MLQPGMVILSFVLSLASPTKASSLDVSHSSIVIQPGATATEIFAANELRDNLSQITGQAIPVIHATQAGTNQIIVGQGEVAKKLLSGIRWQELKPEQTLVRSVGDNLVIAGGRERGTLYAVYRLLAKKCGARWWAPWATTLPKNPSLKFENLNESETPAFEYREAYWNHTNGQAWALHNFANGASVNTDDDHGGKIIYQGFVHTYYPLVPPDKFFAIHPEWYSLINGKRTTDNAQLCTTNPALRDFVVAQVEAELKANPKATIVSVSQNDCFRPCQCDTCRALVKQEGSEAALVLDLANYVGDHIKDKFPNVAVDTLAYQWSRHPTKTMRPRPNVVVRLCSIECNFAQPLSAPVNDSFGNDIRGWSKLTQRLYIWDYCTNFAHYLQPQPDYFALGPTLKWFSQNGVKGVFEEGDYTSSGGDMAELKAWLIDQMLWDPKQDPDDLVDEFLKGYYGPAAEPIKSYLHLIADAAQSTHVSFALGSNASFLNYDVMSKAQHLWNQARILATNDPVHLARVNISALSPESVWLAHWNEFREAAKQKGDPWPFAPLRQQEATRWLAQLKAQTIPGYPQITAVDEGGTSPEQFINSLGP